MNMLWKTSLRSMASGRDLAATLVRMDHGWTVSMIRDKIRALLIMKRRITYFQKIHIQWPTPRGGAAKIQWDDASFFA